MGDASPQKAVEAAVAWFDQEAAAYHERNPRPSERLEEFLRLVPSGGRILDIGCGPGVDVEHLASRGYQATGVDAAPGMIALARERFPAGDFRAADMRALPFDAASFDGALAMYSLIFLPKQEVTAVLSVLARFLRPRGVLLMAVQGGAPAEVGEPNLFSVMTPEEIRGYLDVAGFEVVHEWIRAPYAHERPFNKIYLLARKRGNAAF